MSPVAAGVERPPPLPEGALELAAEHFDLARERAEVRSWDYRVAGGVVRVRIVGPALSDELGRACEHLRIEATGEAPILAVDVWHEEETGIGRPGPPPDPDLAPYGILSASEDRRYVAEERPHSMGWLDRKTGRAIVWVSSVRRLHLDERARPFHRFLALRLQDRGIQFIHAGLVSWEGGGALFTGRGGSGKSTASISCVLDGFQYLGDDFIGLEAREDGSFVGHSLYGTAVIDLGHMGRFPALAGVSETGNYPFEPKSVAWLGELEDVRFEASTPIRAVVLPVVEAREDATVAAPASAREALLALAPSSVLYLPSAGTRAMDRLGALVEGVPSYRLRLGRDPARIPDRVRDILAGSWPGRNRTRGHT